MRRDEERERSLISDGEDNNTKKRDTFFFCDTRTRGDYYTPRMGRDLPLSFSLSLYINMLYGLLCVLGDAWRFLSHE